MKKMSWTKQNELIHKIILKKGINTNNPKAYNKAWLEEKTKIDNKNIEYRKKKKITKRYSNPFLNW